MKISERIQKIDDRNHWIAQCIFNVLDSGGEDVSFEYDTDERCKEIEQYLNYYDFAYASNHESKTIFVYLDEKFYFYKN